MPKQIEKNNILLYIGAAILLVALLYSLHSILSPLIIGITLLTLLIPFNSNPIARTLLYLVIFLLFFWLFNQVQQVMLPFVVSLVLAYLFDPLADRLHRWKFPRWLSSLFIVVLVVGFFIVVLIFLIPQIINELGELIESSIDYAPVIKGWVETDVMNFLQRFNIQESQINDFLVKEIPHRIESVLNAFFQGALSITSGVSAALGQVLNILLIPFLTYYLLKDFDSIKEHTRKLLPRNQSKLVRHFANQIDKILTGFFRGQLLVCLIVATLTTILLAIFGAPYALVIGLMAGVLNIIPYIGLAITLIVGILIGLFSPDPLINIIKIVVIIETVQILEGSFLSPKIVGDRVGLHPAWVMFFILVFSKIWGAVGLLVAVPLGATAKVLLSNWYSGFKNKLETVETS